MLRKRTVGRPSKIDEYEAALWPFAQDLLVPDPPFNPSKGAAKDVFPDDDGLSHIPDLGPIPDELVDLHRRWQGDTPPSLSEYHIKQGLDLVPLMLEALARRRTGEKNLNKIIKEIVSRSGAYDQTKSRKSGRSDPVEIIRATINRIDQKQKRLKKINKS